MLASTDSQGAAGAASGFSARQLRAALKRGGAQRLAFAAASGVIMYLGWCPAGRQYSGHTDSCFRCKQLMTAS